VQSFKRAVLSLVLSFVVAARVVGYPVSFVDAFAPSEFVDAVFFAWFIFGFTLFASWF
jgi:hypothetical protein